jgi:molecular chaperone HscA
VFEVFSTGRDSSLGGGDFDVILVELIRQRSELTGKLSKRLHRQLLDKVKETKEILSYESLHTVQFDDDTGKHYAVMVSIYNFEKLITHLVKNTLLV